MDEIYLATALHDAVWACNLEKLKKDLVETGEDVNAEDSYGNTPLLIACDVHYPNVQLQLDMIDYLLKNGANIAARNNYNDSVLHYAVINSNKVKVIEKLLEHGANVNVLFEVAKDVTNEIVACMIPYEGQIAEDNINEWKKLRLRGLLF